MLWMHVPAHVRSAATTKVSEKMLQGRWLERRTGSPSYHAYLAHGSLRIGSGNRGGQGAEMAPWTLLLLSTLYRFT